MFLDQFEKDFFQQKELNNSNNYSIIFEILLDFLFFFFFRNLLNFRLKNSFCKRNGRYGETIVREIRVLNGDFLKI